MNQLPGIRLGGTAIVTSEEIVCGTDAKYRWAYETAPLPGLRRRCLLFTMDESRVSRCRVKGHATAKEVTHAFAVWVGGQSQPALRFEPPKILELSAVRSIAADPTRGQIRLGRKWGSLLLLVSPQQLDPILDFLRRNCPQASVK